MSALSGIDPHDAENERCQQCDGRRPVYANGKEVCGVCYGIKKGYYTDPENDPSIRNTYRRGWADINGEVRGNGGGEE